MKYITVVLLFIFFTNCRQKPICTVNAAVLKSNDSILLEVKKEKFLLHFLNKMEEPELENLNEETYRFMIVGPFGDNRIYRIRKDNEHYVLISKSYKTFLSDSSKIEEVRIGRLSREIKTTIQLKDWNEIKNSIDKLNFWAMPVRIKDNHYLDGTGYVIEGYTTIKNECTNRNYHATQRISPNDTTLYKSLFNQVIKLTE